jgi:hypothetical protein
MQPLQATQRSKQPPNYWKKHLPCVINISICAVTLGPNVLFIWHNITRAYIQHYHCFLKTINSPEPCSQLTPLRWQYTLTSPHPNQSGHLYTGSQNIPVYNSTLWFEPRESAYDYRGLSWNQMKVFAWYEKNSSVGRIASKYWYLVSDE